MSNQRFFYFENFKTKKKTQDILESFSAMISMSGDMQDYSQLNHFTQEVAHV
jgi:hypothetical protein